ncbi:MAG: hypothetical protein ACTSXU_08405 [Promethearchaeota archaeon]
MKNVAAFSFPTLSFWCFNQKLGGKWRDKRREALKNKMKKMGWRD